MWGPNFVLEQKFIGSLCVLWPNPSESKLVQCRLSPSGLTIFFHCYPGSGSSRMCGNIANMLPKLDQFRAIFQVQKVQLLLSKDDQVSK